MLPLRPEGFLPDWAYIDKSTVPGVQHGVFTNVAISAGDYLGPVRTDVIDLFGRKMFARSAIGFIGNCDDENPNTYTVYDELSGETRLYASRVIATGEEIRWKYTLEQYGGVDNRPWSVV